MRHRYKTVSSHTRPKNLLRCYTHAGEDEWSDEDDQDSVADLEEDMRPKVRLIRRCEPYAALQQPSVGVLGKVAISPEHCTMGNCWQSSR